MMKKWIALMLALVFACAAFSGAALAATQYAKVVTPTSDGTVYVRTVAGAGKPIAGVARNGDTLVILNKGNTWHKVRVERTGLTGYMYGAYIRFTTSSATDSTGEWGSGADTGWGTSSASPSYKADASVTDKDTVVNRFVTINSSDGFANLRWGPSDTNFSVISKIYNGDTVWALELNGNWYRCVTQSGLVGYIHKTLVELGATSTGAIGHVASVRSSDGFANLREGASTGYSVIRRLNYGTSVSVTDVSGEWLRVNVRGTNTTGYVYRTLIRFLSQGATTGNVNLRSGPSTSYSKLRVLSNGSKVALLATDNKFCRVDTGSEIGYMSKNYLSF